MTNQSSSGVFKRLEERVLDKSDTRQVYLDEREKQKTEPEARLAALAPRVGQILRAARKRRHLTQAEQSKASGILQSEISRIESGGATVSPSMQTVVNYAHALDMEVVLMLKPRETELPSELVSALDKTLEADESAVADLGSVRLWGVL